MLKVGCMMRVLALLPEMTTAHLFLLSACTKLAAEVSFIEPRQRARDLKMKAQNIDKRKKKKKKTTTFKNFVNLLQPFPLNTR